MAKRRTPKPKKVTTRSLLRAAAGLERAAHFASGGSSQSWNGGRMWTAQNRRAVSSKTACRRPVDD
jgi:hypothetical protein